MGKASTKAKDKYNENNYDRFTLRVAKGDKEKYKDHAATKGKSLNSYIVDLINDDIEKSELNNQEQS